MNSAKFFRVSLSICLLSHGTISFAQHKSRVLYTVKGLQSQSGLLGQGYKFSPEASTIGNIFQCNQIPLHRNMWTGVARFVAEHTDQFVEITKNVIKVVAAGVIVGKATHDLSKDANNNIDNVDAEQKNKNIVTAAEAQPETFDGMLDNIFGDNPDADSYRGNIPSDKKPFLSDAIVVNKKPEEQSVYDNFLDTIFGDNPSSPSYRGAESNSLLSRKKFAILQSDQAGKDELAKIALEISPEQWQQFSNNSSSIAALTEQRSYIARGLYKAGLKIPVHEGTYQALAAEALGTGTDVTMRDMMYAESRLKDVYVPTEGLTVTPQQKYAEKIFALEPIPLKKASDTVVQVAAATLVGVANQSHSKPSSQPIASTISSPKIINRIPAMVLMPQAPPLIGKKNPCELHVQKMDTVPSKALPQKVKMPIQPAQNTVRPTQTSPTFIATTNQYLALANIAILVATDVVVLSKSIYGYFNASTVQKAGINEQKTPPQKSLPTKNTGNSGAGNNKGPQDNKNKDAAKNAAKTAVLEAARKELEKNKKRVVNKITKTEFFNDPAVKNNYQSTPNGAKVLKDGGIPIHGAKRLEWDHTHNDVEAYGDIIGKKHMGSIDPLTKKFYKGPVIGRESN